MEMSANVVDFLMPLSPFLLVSIFVFADWFYAHYQSWDALEDAFCRHEHLSSDIFSRFVSKLEHVKTDPAFDQYTKQAVEWYLRHFQEEEWWGYERSRFLRKVFSLAKKRFKSMARLGEEYERNPSKSSMYTTLSVKNEEDVRVLRYCFACEFWKLLVTRDYLHNGSAIFARGMQAIVGTFRKPNYRKSL